MAFTRLEHAELVALRIGEHDPRHGRLPDVDMSGAGRDQSFDEVRLMIRESLARSRWTRFFAVFGSSEAPNSSAGTSND